MKALNSKLLAVFLLLTSLSSCIIVTDHPGPNGVAGNAYFGVDYDVYMPYSYWDNNNRIPVNPELGMSYPTNAGVFDFEYFINPYEYWYGSYTIFRNAGGPGRPGGEPGFNGADTYLMLICNPEGFYEVRGNYRVSNPDGNTVVVESLEGKNRFKVEMTKTNINERPTANIPKYLNDQK